MNISDIKPGDFVAVTCKQWTKEVEVARVNSDSVSAYISDEQLRELDSYGITYNEPKMINGRLTLAIAFQFITHMAKPPIVPVTKKYQKNSNWGIF